MALIQCPECGKEFSDTAKTCPNCGFRERYKSDKNNIKGFIFFGVIIIIVLFVLGIIGFFVHRKNLPVAKYGQEAVVDGQAAIFTVDQYLDGNLEEREFRHQISLYNKELEITEKSSQIYTKIKLMKLFTTDSQLLEYRNELAKLLRLPER